MAELKVRMTVEEIDALMDEAFPNARRLGWVLESVGAGTARVRLPVGDQHLRPGDTVSGPTLFALVDTTMYFAVLAVIGPRALALTTNCNINFLRRAGRGEVVAVARLLKVGRRLVVGEVAVHRGDDDAVVAHATLTYSIPPDASGLDIGDASP
jgi:uncharacterized protein (TIGR00369 family)